MLLRACQARSTFRTTQLSTLPSRARQAGSASTVHRGPVHPYSQRRHALPLVVPAPLIQAHAEPFVMPGLATLSAMVSASTPQAQHSKNAPNSGCKGGTGCKTMVRESRRVDALR